MSNTHRVTRKAITPADGFGAMDSYSLYSRDVRDYKLLTAEEEQELAKRVERGDREAKAQLINSNLRLVMSIAKKYKRDNVDIMDLIQEGNLGLIHAVDKYDWRSGNRFSTYATWWIKHFIKRAAVDLGRSIRLPAHTADDLFRINVFKDSYLRDMKVEPTIDEISAAVGIPRERVTELITSARSPISLETPIGEEGESQFGDLIPDENAVDPEDAAIATIVRETLRKALAALTPREQRVIALRFGMYGGDPLTLEQVGGVLDLTRERIRQIEKKALRTLRNSHSLAQLMKAE